MGHSCGTGRVRYVCCTLEVENAVTGLGGLKAELAEEQPDVTDLVIWVVVAHPAVIYQTKRPSAYKRPDWYLLL